MVHLTHVGSDPDLAHCRELFREYADSLGSVFVAESDDNTFAKLPGEYAAPDGCLMLAYIEKMAVGCVALKKVRDNVCEMKRLYVRPPFRREGIGRKLALKVIEHARAKEYKLMLLDTLPPMKEATSLYRSLRFKEIAPYRDNPVEGELFMELILS
ncbi:MAG TPA: GNAT family N-acetyltransferase [Bacteroidota bacterium]